MKRIITALGLSLLASSCAWCWNMSIEISDDVTYRGNDSSGRAQYYLDGQLAAYEDRLGSEIVYYSAEGKKIGSRLKVGSDWEFRNASGESIGSIVKVGNSIEYRNDYGDRLGRSLVVGSGTEYRNGRDQTIGHADTSDMPLRPIPIEKHILALSKSPDHKKKISSGNIAAAADRTSLVNIEKISWDMPAAKAGLRAGDIIIAFEGDEWSVFDIAESNPDKTNQKFENKLDTKSNQQFSYIVYRPAPGEFGEPQGKFLKVGPLPVGKKGYRYVSSYQAVTYNQNNSSSYARKIGELYKTAKIEQAPVSLPDAAGYRKDSRAFPGAHQDFSEILSSRGPLTGWFWYDDKSGIPD